VQWFAQLAGIKQEQVPYRGQQAINDLIAGHVKLGSSPLMAPATRAFGATRGFIRATAVRRSRNTAGSHDGRASPAPTVKAEQNREFGSPRRASCALLQATRNTGERHG